MAVNDYFSGGVVPIWWEARYRVKVGSFFLEFGTAKETERLYSLMNDGTEEVIIKRADSGLINNDCGFWLVMKIYLRRNQRRT